MADRFEYSVYVANHPDDAPIANVIVDKLRADGMRVCFEGSDPRDGESPQESTDRYLRTARAMVLLVSSNSLGPGWGILERRTARFRDPKESKRKFVPVFLDKCEDRVPAAFQQYRFVKLERTSKKAFDELVAACRSPSLAGQAGKYHRVATEHIPLSNSYDVADLAETPDGSAILIAAGQEIDYYNIETFSYKKRYTSAGGRIKCVSLSPNGSKLAVGFDNSSIQILHLRGGSFQPLHSRHSGDVVSLEWSPDGSTLYSTGGDSSVRSWRFGVSKGQGELLGHSNGVGQVSLSPDGTKAASASYDNRLKIWELTSGNCVATFGDHGFPINSVAWLPDGKYLLSGSDECTIRLWDLSSQSCVISMEGHRDSIWRVVYSPQNRIAASGSWDNTVRIWEIWSGKCLQVLKFKDLVNFVRFSGDGTRLYVGAGDTLHMYKFNQSLLKKVSSLETDTRRYSNATVVLVGESMSGKTHLAHRLIEDKWVPMPSTHGMHIWPFDLPTARDEGAEREVWLWDLAGQPDYRLIHQMFLDETSLAVVVFDPANEDALQKIKHWELALRQAVGHDPVKVLVSTKSDVSGVPLTRDKIRKIVEERGYCDYVRTSAYIGTGRADLLKAIAENIPWDRTPSIATPRLFKKLKDGVLQIRAQGHPMIQFAALKQQLQSLNPKERFEESDLRAVVRLLAGQGLIKPLNFGDVILLQTELLSAYAAAVTRAAREHPEGIGCIAEHAVHAGDFDFEGMKREPKPVEDILLRAVVEMFINRSLCIRQTSGEGELLVFPAHYNVEPEIKDQPHDLVVYQFAGNVGNIYTTLVVRLRYTQGFEEPALYKNAAMFRTNDGHRLGFSFHSGSQGTGTLKIFFDTAVADETRVTFLKYIHDHLYKRSSDVRRQRFYVCPKPHCGRPFEAMEALRFRKAAGESYVRCVYCDTEIPINDLVEQKFHDDRFNRVVQEMDQKAQFRLSSESKELLLVGQATVAAAEANQIFRPLAIADHGIDGEIEFRNDRGEASGQRVYLQLKSGESHTYERMGDKQEIFSIKNPRHIRYWQDQAYPVYLVIREPDDSVTWMNITDYLRNRPDKESLQVRYEGEPFDAYSILRLATRMVP